jgi:hypothetical protein
MIEREQMQYFYLAIACGHLSLITRRIVPGSPDDKPLPFVMPNMLYELDEPLPRDVEIGRRYFESEEGNQLFIKMCIPWTTTVAKVLDLISLVIPRDRAIGFLRQLVAGRYTFGL